MYRSILVPLDGSSFSEDALPVARTIARRTGASVRLVHVFPPPIQGTLDSMPSVDPELNSGWCEHTRTYLEYMQARFAAGSETKPSIALLEGPVVETLAKEAEQTRADLVILTTHGRGGLTRLWLGSVADGLIHQLHVPILLLRPHDPALDKASSRPTAAKEGGAFRRILVPLDGSELAEQILRPAIDLATEGETEITLLQVVEPLIVDSYSRLNPVPRVEHAATKRREQDARAYLMTIAGRLRLEGLRVATRVVIDPRTAVAIRDEALALRSDLIALATHGLGGLARLVAGSVADKVMRTADVPVLLIRPLLRPARRLVSGETIEGVYTAL